MLSGLVRGLGLPDEAGAGVEAFLRAVQRQANGDGSTAEDSMDTD
jgi:26S proteasome regulatory subunit N13